SPARGEARGAETDATHPGASTPRRGPVGTAIDGLLKEARTTGDVRRGAQVFASPKFACLSCHRVGQEGGAVGPVLATVGLCVRPEEIVESILYPSRRIKSGYEAMTVATTDGAIRQGFEQAETAKAIILRDPAKGDSFTIAKADVAEVRKGISLMPDGL